MAGFTFDVYSHHVVVSGYTQEGRAILVDFIRQRLTQWGYTRVGHSRFERRILSQFATTRKDRAEYRFHRNCMRELSNFIENARVLDNHITYHLHEPPEPRKVQFKWEQSFKLRQTDQIPLKEYVIAEGNTKLLDLQVGKGKTALSLYSTYELGEVTVLILRPGYFDRWMTDLKGLLKLKPGELMTVKGQKDLSRLIGLAVDGELEAKFIMISNKTFYFYIDYYERMGSVEGIYAVPPQDFFTVVKAGFRIIDEVHQDFHFNFKLDLYTNIKKILSNSATFWNDNPFLNRMYELAYPKTIRTTVKLIYDKYIRARAVMYNFKDPTVIEKRSRNLQNQYSHVKFEQYLMNKPPLLTRYVEMIGDITYESFVRIMERGQKMFIFCATVEMCTEIQKHLKRILPDLRIGRYTMDDEESVLKKSDITVTTIQSAGTGIDVANLRVTLMTNSLSSTSANEQAKGRLRRLKDFPDVEPEFIYLVCSDLSKHLDHHEKKVAFFSDKVLSHQVHQYDKAI